MPVRSGRRSARQVNGIDAQGAKIEVERGVVTMGGLASNAEAVRQAYGLVKRIRGVKKIDNRLITGDYIGWD